MGKAGTRTGKDKCGMGGRSRGRNTEEYLTLLKKSYVN